MDKLQFDYICLVSVSQWASIPRFFYNNGCLTAEGSAHETEKLRIAITKCLQLVKREIVVYNTPEEANEAAKIADVNQNDIVLHQIQNQVLVIGPMNGVVNAFNKLSLFTIMKTIRTFYCTSFPLELQIMHGDIRNANAEFIAVASTARMCEQQGAGKHICNMLGEDYVKECALSIQTDGVIQHGECRVIATGLCVRKWIGNASVPTHRKDPPNPAGKDAVMKAYASCLDEADNRCGVMAMTFIGSDVFRGGFPFNDCVRWLCQSIESFEPKRLKKILLVEYDGEKATKIADLLIDMSEWQYSSNV